MNAGSGRVIGRVVATEQYPATPYQFHFWTVSSAELGIGAIVRVDADPDRTVFGVVTDGRSYADHERPFEDLAEASGNPEAERRRTPTSPMTLWTAAVLRQVPAEPLQPVPLEPVRNATSEDVVWALRMETYATGTERTGIPVGTYSSGGLNAPVFVDADFLLGPESAHLNIAGVSGLATKTSAVQFLLSSIFQHFPASRGSVAAVCFNVKGPDLCFMDRPGAITDADRELYGVLDVEPRPFDRVRYYAPFKPDGVNINTLRSHPDLAGSVTPLIWGLREVLDYHEVILSREDIDAKADALIDFISDRVLEKEFRDDWGGVHRVLSFADLEKLFRAIFDGLESAGRGDIWRTHHVATIRKVRNRLLNVSTRCDGLVTDDGVVSDLPFGQFEDRGLYVVDVAGVDQLAQDLVFTRLVSKLREHLERRDLGVDHVIVFVDELNKYAPADGPDTYVRKMLMDVSERGRYLGLVLFGAEQFRSHVHRRVTGNAGTALFGRMDVDELATPGYQVFSPATRSRMSALSKGELMVRHPHFTHPVFLRFPRPAVMSGREGVERFPPASDLPFDAAVWRRLADLDRAVTLNAVRDLIAGRSEEDVRRAVAAVSRTRPDDPLGYFRAALGRRIVRESPGPRMAGTVPIGSVDDPYAP